MIWSSVASDSSASIVRSLVPKSQDLGIAKIGFSQRLTRTPGKGLCKSSAFCHSERISRTLPSLFKPSPKTPERRAIYSRKEKRKILGFSVICYLVTMNNNWEFLLGQLSWILGKSELGLHPFCSIPLKSWGRCKSDPSGPLQPKRIIYHKKVPYIVLKAWATENAML